MKLIILTLHWNKKDSIVRLKDSLIPSLTGIDYQWHIRDNNSSDGSYEEMSKWNNENIHITKYDTNNETFSQGMNYLFDFAKPKDDDLILFLNNDVQFADTKSIQKMINILERDRDVGIVGAKLLYTNSNKIQHCGVVFTENRKLPGSPALPIHLFRGTEVTEHQDKNRLFQACTAAVMLLKASDFRAVNGFDDNLKWSFEDVDLNLKIGKNLGKKIVMCGGVKVYHDESASLKLNPVNKLYLNSNITYLTNKWRNKVETDVYNYLKDTNYGLYHGPK
jgi:GT2 family glycosyltransferase